MPEAAERRAPTVVPTPWLTALPPMKRWVLHGDVRARTRAAPVFGVDFAEAACRALIEGPRATLWLGPDEYLLLDWSAERPDALEAALERALADVPHALVDLSHRQVALELRGPLAATLLSGACPLDLDLAAFPVGMCTRTVLAKADILLWRTAPERFHLEAWRSFVGYVTGLLSEIASEHSGSSG